MRISDWSSDVCSSDLTGPSHARTDRVHADVLLRIIERRGLGQLYDAGLGGAIDAVMLHADDGRRRRGVDDRATAGFQHRRDAVFHAEEHAFQIDGLDPVIAVFALLVQCRHLSAEIGRAAWWERVCPYGLNLGGGVQIKKK